MAVSHQPIWQSGEVVAVDEAATGVARIVLRTEHAHSASPGTHVDLQFDASGKQLVRSYSVVRGSADGREVTLSVQRARPSRGGSAFMHSLSVGDKVEMTQPLQNFPLGVGATRYVLLAGGIGITALVSMAAALQARQADYVFHYAGRTRSVMAYLDELVAVHGDRLHVHVDDEGSSLDVDALLGDVCASEDRATELYMCGPIRLMDAVRRGWATRELPPTNLRFETFGNSGSWEPETFLVKVPQFDAEVEVTPTESMLDALERAGLDVMSDCRKGECGLCQVKILALDGRVDHRDVFFSETQQRDNLGMCACVSRVVAGDAAGGPVSRDEDLAAGESDVGAQGPGVVTVQLP